MSAPVSPHDTYQYKSLDTVGPFTRALWYASGADAQLLARCPFSDRVKYQGMGGVVLATAALAFLSGSYAFYVVFGPRAGTALVDAPVDPKAAAIAIGFGLVWSLIIFNIDRFIVASTGKGDGTERITLGELGSALPRIVMATIIGVCLSAPLEIRILKTEIDTELASRQKVERLRLDKATDQRIEKHNAELAAKVESAQKRIAAGGSRLDVARQAHEQDYEKRRQEILRQRHTLEEEAEGASASGKSGRGPAWRDKDENLKRLETELDTWDKNWKASRATEEANQKSADGPVLSDVDRWKKELDDMSREVKAEKAENGKAAANMDGLMMRIRISHEIGGAVPWLIMFLLLAIEVCPIFFKMMLVTGTYDYLTENQKKLAAARFGIEPASERLEADGKLLEISPRFHAPETVLNAERKRLQSEARLTAAAHDAYVERTLPEVAKDPMAYAVPESEA